ncbi:hypothetical protein D5018_11660 [Parashewanella curva]|uniref:Uncharacterized protein n=1 Tax=Parashewanella curva TaxID=2338552 RepID=A0A3L8PXJ3_9GAMM|nr:hypothetical protein [Parashewanella curva]RLV59519.1 hypothetical protein D5018_11660 [Parashewanella curva]
MKLSVKAALYSAFVCPGAGHLLQGYKYRGYGFIALTLISLVTLIKPILDVSQRIADQIVSGELPLDPAAIMKTIHQSVYSEILVTANLGLILLIACWIVALLDCIREGVKS